MGFVLRDAKIVHQLIDGETIVLNLETGSYYSLLNASSVIWQLLIKGGTLEQVVAAFGSTATAGSAIGANAIERFVTQLQDEALLVPGGTSLSQADLDRLFAEQMVALGGAPIEDPTFEKFTDMEGFLLVDPIHDVDEEGWPSVPSGE